EAETPGLSSFIDQNEWIGTRDMAAFLSVPAAIQFQRDQSWDEVRSACHDLACYAQDEICSLFKLPALHSSTETWFAQMSAAPLPADTDIVRLKIRLYDEYKIEVPLVSWKDHRLIR